MSENTEREETPTERVIRVIREQARAELAAEIRAILDHGESSRAMLTRISVIADRAVRVHKDNL